MGNVAVTASELVEAVEGVEGVLTGPEIVVDARQMRARRTAAGQAMPEIGQDADAILVSTARTSTSPASPNRVWVPPGRAGVVWSGVAGQVSSVYSIGTTVRASSTRSRSTAPTRISTRHMRTYDCSPVWLVAHDPDLTEHLANIAPGVLNRLYHDIQRLCILYLCSVNVL